MYGCEIFVSQTKEKSKFMQIDLYIHLYTSHAYIYYVSYYIGIHAAMQWREKPRDLDLHLFSFDSKTLDPVTHCFFGNRGEDIGLEREERLNLDRDDMQVRRMQSFCLWCARCKDRSP
jgi:hypothetical protein